MVAYNEMDVGWSVWMAIHQLQQLSGRTIEWNGVRSGLQAVERIFALFIRHELPAQVAIYLIPILLFVQAWIIIQPSSLNPSSHRNTIRGCLPHVHRCVREWFLGLRVCYNAVHVYHLPILRSIECDGGAVLPKGCIMTEERS